MNRLNQILLLVFLCAAYGASSQISSEINGKIKGAKGKTIYLMHEEKGKLVACDSSNINLFGSYKLNANVVLDDFYRVSLDKKDGIILILKGDEKLKIKSTTDFKSMNYSVSGSADSELIQDFFSMKLNPSVSKDSLREYATHFVENNAKSLAVFLALNEVKDLAASIDVAEKGIGESYPNSIYHNALKRTQQAIKSQAAQAGNSPAVKLAPELNMPNPEGEILTLESLRGKVVLIDFWASWCGPCRRENPNVVRLYNQYKDQGFEVFSVSLDKDKARWEAAIIKDNLNWSSHVSDLKGWGSAATSLYGFRGIPYTVLIDREGKIIQTRLRGAALEKKLEEIFSK